MHVQSVDGPLDQAITEENDLKQPEYNTKSSFISRLTDQLCLTNMITYQRGK